jgi:hypothetical protein
MRKVESKMWVNFWTPDEPWIMWVNPPTGSSMPIDEELYRRVCQTIGATKSMLRVFLNAKEFVIIDLLPRGTPFIASYFVDNSIILLANRHTHKLGEMTRGKLHLHFDNSNLCAARHTQ